MSSINSLMNSGSSSVSGNSVASSSLSRLSEQLSDLESDTTMTDAQKEKQVAKIKSAMSAASSVSANIANASSLINGMLGTNTDSSSFSGLLGNDVSSMRLLLSASSQSQKEARVLASEIQLDKIRGLDTSDKEEKLSNLSSSISMMNNTLSSRISNALASEDTDRDTRAIIDKINDQLAENQKKLDKEFGHTSEDDKTESEKTETTTETETKEKTAAEKEYDRIHKPSVIDEINSGLAENQKKLDEEFGNNKDNG
ncbi:MAG: hypothetical protein HDT44_06310 [Ruminococcaceae bacterium]|nr:hypothetical protein [Oscillospiraceae bacterium]